MSSTVTYWRPDDSTRPGYDGAGAVTPWYENTWDYADTAALFGAGTGITENDAGGGDVELRTGQTGLPWGGSTLIECIFPGGPGSQTAGVDIFPPDADVDQLTEFWMEVYLRFDNNFEINSDHKLIFYLQSVTASGSSRWEIKPGLFGHEIRAQISNGTVYEEIGAIPPVGDGNPTTGSVRPDLETWLWDGTWKVLRTHARMESSVGAEDGLHDAWLDDEKFLESGPIPTVYESGRYFDYWSLGRNGDPVNAASFRIGRFRLWDTDPGWGY